MAEKIPSQTQQKTNGASAGSDPVSAGMATWAKLTQEHIDRVTSFADELAGMESRAYERTREAMDQAEKLGREWVDYVSALSSEWRRLAIQSTRSAAEFLASSRA